MSLASVFRKIDPRNILVVGDLMLDTYTVGKVERVSPEAPVTILHAERDESRPGGAGNVALNLVSLGQSVKLMGRVGSDQTGDTLRASLNGEGIDTDHLVLDSNHRTPLKNRFVAGGQQLLRVDREEITPLSPDVEAKLIESLDLSGIDLVAISDYGKGFLTPGILRHLIDAANSQNIPIIVDPKGRDFAKYAGATLIKPNYKEAVEAAGGANALDTIASVVLTASQAKHLLITRSEDGMSLFSPGEPSQNFPVEALEVRDVTGAGDTVLAIIAAAMANELPLADGIRLANLGASLAIQRFGCARISIDDLAAAFLHTDKLFDHHRLPALLTRLQNRAFNLLQIDHFTPKLFKKIRDLDGEVIAYAPSGDPDLLELLTALPEVTCVLLEKRSLQELTLTLTPQAIYTTSDSELCPLLSLA